MTGERVQVRATGEIGVVVDVEIDDGEYWYSVDGVYGEWSRLFVGTDLISLSRGRNQLALA